MVRVVLDTVAGTYALAARALAQGGHRKSLTRVTWDISGNCSNGYLTEVTAKLGRKPGEKYATWKAGEQYAMTVEIITRCRECENCVRARANRWRYAAKVEWACAARTWLGTLTLSPDAQARAGFAAVAANPKKWITMTPEQRFAARHREISQDLTKMIKRIRVNSGAAVRYLLVAEPHTSGLPHYHMLLHEVRADRPVRYDVLQHVWTLGFSKWKLVTDPAGATYVAKYLSKSMNARVRASVGYGKTQTLSEHSFNPLKRENECDPTQSKNTPD